MSWLGSRNDIVAKMSIAGVRGILDRGGDFELARDRSPESIALYAPSACGKSSYADAVEYLFSEDGSVAHLVLGRCCLLVRCGAQRANRGIDRRAPAWVSGVSDHSRLALLFAAKRPPP